MTSLKLGDLPQLPLEKVLKKLHEKSYFRLQQTCKGIYDFIRANPIIKHHMEIKLPSWIIDENRALPFHGKLWEKDAKFAEAETLCRARLDCLNPPVEIIEKHFDDYYNILKNYRITAKNLCLINVKKENRWSGGQLATPFTTAQCSRLIQVLKPESVALYSHGSKKYEALLQDDLESTLKEVTLYIELPYVAKALEKFLTHCHTITLYVGIRSIDQEDIFEMFVTILERLRSASLSNLRHILVRIMGYVPRSQEMREILDDFRFRDGVRCMLGTSGAFCEITTNTNTEILFNQSMYLE